MNKIAYFYTLGCRLNFTETAHMAQLLENVGYATYVQETESQEPDFCIVNSCTVTTSADNKCYKLIARLQQKYPNAKLIVVGCLSQVAKEDLIQKKGVDFVLGNKEKENLAFYIQKLEAQVANKDEVQERVFVSPIEKGTFKQISREQKLFRTRANLKIQDGCNFYCSYCIIPFARGVARSRDSEDAVIEATNLVKAGVQEIVLTGVNLGCYQTKDGGLLDLLNKFNQIEGLKRVRISSIEPKTINKELLLYMQREDTNLVHSLHLPLQAANDVILQRMKRKYTLTEYGDMIAEAKETVPNICISTDIITGFPGETDSIFAESKKWLATMPIHFFHVFPYAERKGVKSASLDQQQTTAVARARAKELITLSQEKHTQYRKQFVNKTLPVLWERSSNTEWYGYTDNYIRVRTQSEKPLDNHIRNSVLLDIQGQYMNAQVID